MQFINSETPEITNILINFVCKVPVLTVDHGDYDSLLTSVLPSLNSIHYVHTFPAFITPSPYPSTSCQWISVGDRIFDSKM